MEKGNRCQWNFDHDKNGKLFIIIFSQEFYIYKNVRLKQTLKALIPRKMINGNHNKISGKQSNGNKW